MAPVTISPLYTAHATAHGGRNGEVKSSDGVIDLKLSMPKELGGAAAAGATNPEQLFAAGYSACFEGALRLVAGKAGKKLGPDVGIAASVTIGKTPDGGFGLAVELKGILPGIPRQEAEGLMHAAHEVCPYSRATRGNIDVKLSVAE
ncbi:organic hydroperoxide resistance protein [Myxococcus stipitatus DSM 14675]|uniref:Organic hydroperoxide resistance protein n=1 Tax=Myxococcus stipitatus (strain DSM 14675 / JCM 12634 / Mx s8) TaxID=1278073 RepID=L7TZS3_MYXSD|nr:organic hydroperoxide resistance protein [Myxococcus stipitatus]AGC42006.1 organic hydroperoxide resistance protein [Myxococcus stipitatus DSM 14675]